MGGNLATGTIGCARPIPHRSTKVPHMTIDQSIFKAYDVRGTYPDQMNEEVAYKIGRSIAVFLSEESGKPASELTIGVGRDMRLSAPDNGGLHRGSDRRGASVLDVGQVGTEVLYWIVNHRGLDGGAMVTASHNPADLHRRQARAREGAAAVR